MALQKKCGYDITLSVLKKADQSGLIGFLAKVLNRQEADIFHRTSSFLANLDDKSVNRLLLRRFNSLGEDVRKTLISRPKAVLLAAQELAGVDNSNIRTNIVEALAALADRRSIPLMLRYLDDPSAPVRERAQYLLHVLSRRYGRQLAAEGGKERDYLRTALRLVLREGEVTGEGLNTLFALGVDGFLLLIPFLRDKNSESHDKIINFLKNENGEPIARCLLFLAKSNYEETRLIARTILKQRSESSFLVTMAKVLVEYTDKEIAPILAMIRYLSWQQVKEKDLNQLEENTQQNLLNLVSSFGGPFSQRVEKLVPFLQSKFVLIRGQTLHILSEMPSNLYFNQLPLLLNDSSEAIALRATNLLNMHDNINAYHYLIKQLGHKSDLIREEAAKKLQGRTFYFLSKRWNNLSPQQKKRAVNTVIKIDRQFSRQILQELQSGDAMRILRSLSIIRSISNPSQFTNIIIDLSIFPDPYVRATAAGLLGNTEGFSTRKTLEQLLKDSDPRVVSNSIESLAKIGSESSVPLLRGFLGHWHNRVRSTAIMALEILGYTNLREPVLQIIADSDKRMKKSGNWLVNKMRAFLKSGKEKNNFSFKNTEVKVLTTGV